MKKQNVTSENPSSSNREKVTTDVSSVLDNVSAAIPDMIDSIMSKIEDISLDSLNSPKQTKFEKDVSTIKSDVESIKFDVVEILRQLPPRERRKPETRGLGGLGDVLNDIFSGRMEASDEGITFGDAPHGITTGNSSVYHKAPNTKWSTTINKVRHVIDSDSDSDSDSDTDTIDISDSDTDTIDISDSDSDVDGLD